MQVRQAADRYCRLERADSVGSPWRRAVSERSEVEVAEQTVVAQMASQTSSAQNTDGRWVHVQSKLSGNSLRLYTVIVLAKRDDDDCGELM